MTRSEEFLHRGYIIRDVEKPENLWNLSGLIEPLAIMSYGVEDFALTHHHVKSPDTLNDLRLKCIARLNAFYGARHMLRALARDALDEIVGNELVQQKRINLSIQLPNDDSSLLPLHSDVWAGDSPYEVVLWVPLVDCKGTRSMFILPTEHTERATARMHELGSVDRLFDEIEKDLVWIDIKRGEYLLFTPTLLHGNVVNRTHETRWSLNCRFKSLFSPYADKTFGDFFAPVNIRPATRVGMRHPL